MNWVDLAAVKRAVGIEQVLEDYGVRLKWVGKDSLRGRCPLPTHCSGQSRESFAVDTAKNVWACHSASCCQARRGQLGGNILDLVAWLEGCSIREAALRLQARGGRPASSGFSGQLVSKGIRVSEPGQELPRLSWSLRVSWHPYLARRGLDRSTAAAFGVGYYAGPGFLRGRIVFPIHDAGGGLVAYAGRAVDGSQPRYLFPAGFRKSQVVYNLHRALRAATERPGRAIVVEGFFDCLKVHQAGYGNVVALLGTSLSERQSELLQTRFPELVLMLDGDAAGRRAACQLAARLRGRVSLYLALMAAGWQPDQLSPEEIRRILCRAARCAPGA